MATPATLKKIDDKKLAAQKRRDKQDQDHLLPLGGMTNAPSAHLLISGTPNPAPRMMDLRPLSGAAPQYMQYRQPKASLADEFVSDYPSAMFNYNYTSFETMSSNPFTYQQMNMGNQQTTNQFGKQQTFADMAGNEKTSSEKQEETPVGQEKDIEMVKFTLHADNIVCFHGKGHFLSSLYPVKTNIDGHDYPSVEHYYQACKIFSLVGPEQAQLLRGIKDPLKAKLKAKDVMHAWRVPNNKIDHWKKTHGLLVLLHGNRHKFSQNAEMREKLLATGDALLCQAYDKDTMYAVGMDEKNLREWAEQNEGKVFEFPAELTEKTIKNLPLVGKGRNILGLLLMQVRKAITEHDAESKKSTEDEPKKNSSISESTIEDYPSKGDDEDNDDDDGNDLADEINAVLGFGNKEHRQEGKENKGGKN